MVIAVASMLVMKTSIDNIIYMIPMSYSLMTTVRPMSMIVEMFLITFIGIMVIYL